MAGSAELAIQIAAINRASAELRAVARDVRGVGAAATAQASPLNALGAGMAKFGNIAKPVFAGLAIGAGAAGVAIASFVKDAAAEQAGIARLTTAIGTLDEAHRGSASTVEQLVASREKLAFSDDQIRDSLSLLITQTQDYDEAARRQAIAMDVARGTGLDLATASRLVGKINEETTNTFGRYGISIRKGASETEALAEIQRRFAGQSQAFANSSAGQWARLGNEIANVKEGIGAALLPAVTELSREMSDFLARHQADIQRFAEGFAEKIPGAIAAVRDALQAARPAVEHVIANMREGFEAIRPIIEYITSHKALMVASLAAIGVAAVAAFAPISAPVLAASAAIAGLVYTVGFARSHWDQIIEGFTHAPQAVLDFLQDHWKDGIVLALTGPLGLLVKNWDDVWKFMPSPVQDAMNAVAGIAESVINGIIRGFEGMTNAAIGGINALLEAARKVDQALPEAISGWDVPGNINKLSLPRVDFTQSRGAGTAETRTPDAILGATAKSAVAAAEAIALLPPLLDGGGGGGGGVAGAARAVADAASPAQNELRELAIVLGKAGISGEAFIASQFLRQTADNFAQAGVTASGAILQILTAMQDFSAEAIRFADRLAGRGMTQKSQIRLSTGEVISEEEWKKRRDEGFRDPDARREVTQEPLPEAENPLEKIARERREAKEGTTTTGMQTASTTMTFNGSITVNARGSVKEALDDLALGVR